MRTSERSRLESLADASPMGLFATTRDGRVTWTNERFKEIWGFGGAIGLDWLERIHPADRDRMLDDVAAGVRSGSRFGTHCRIRRGDDAERWIRLHLAPVEGAREWTGTIEDVTSEVDTLTALAEREAEFRLLTEHSSDVLSRVDEEGRYRYVSPAARTVFGWEPEHLVGRTPFELGIMAPELRRELDRAARLSARDGSVQRLAYPVRHRDGRTVWVETTLRFVHGRGGGVVSVTRDVTERQAAEAELHHQATHDALTGLPNRTLFRDRLVHALAGARRSGRWTAVVFLDLDRFKVINDSLGHAAGDELLVALARRLSTVLREGDTLARFGGDELTVLLEDLANPADARLAVDRLRDVLQEPFALGGGAGEVALRASFGVALCEAGRSSPDVLLRDADVAMYRAKEGGRDRVAVFDHRMRAEAEARLEVEQALRAAVVSDGLRLHFQPIVELPSGRITGFEALVRWQHPTRGPLAPADFLPVAEDAGLVGEVGGWVLATALDQLAEWHPRDPGLRVGVNVAPEELTRADFADRVLGDLSARGLPGSALVLEITERAVMDVDPDVVRRLRDGGVALVLDDFGTGWSSLVQLRRFPVTGLKIDRSFVHGLGRSDGDEAIVRAVLSLGEALNLSVVAEGVETRVQLDRLAALGCRRVQGYGFAHPFPGPEASALVGTSLALR